MLLRRRLLLLFVGIVAGVLVLGSWMVVTLRERDDAQQRERRLSVSLERVAQLSTAYADQETGERGYVLSGGVDVLPGARTRTAAPPPRRLVPQLRADLDTARPAPAPRGPHDRDGRVATPGRGARDRTRERR